MPTRWLVPDVVRDALGAHVDRVVGDLRDNPDRGCRVCHRAHDADGRAVNTLALLRPSTRGRSRALVGFTHDSCAPPSGVIDIVGSEDENPGDSRAIAGDLSLDGVLTPVLVFEPGNRGYIDTGGELSDLFAATMLRRGFHLLLGPVTDAAPGRAPGWTVKIAGSQVQLTGPDQLGLSPRWAAGFEHEWDRLARRTGWVLVIAGTEIVLRDGRAGPTHLAEAIAAGRVVTAMVRAG